MASFRLSELWHRRIVLHPERTRRFAAMLQRLKQEKPWAKLRMTRRDYEAKRPWARSGVSRKQWEADLQHFPDEAIDLIIRDAEAERLVSAIFGKVD